MATIQKTKTRSKKPIYAKGLMITMLYDLNRMLEDNVPNKTIHKSFTKRLARIKDSKWERVIWD